MTQKLYVGNLSYATTEDTLRTLFAEFGAVQSVKVITDRETGRPRGFGFVEMATEQEAEEAISGLNGKSVDNREIRVDKAKPSTGGRDSRDSRGRRDSRDRSRGGGGQSRW
jgi:cold-inducible RNA-binding protein